MGPNHRHPYESNVGNYGAGGYSSGTYDGGYGYGGFRAGTGSYDRSYDHGMIPHGMEEPRPPAPAPGPTRGGHAGKGPKDFARADERIREDVCQLMADHDDLDAGGIEVTVEHGEVTLAGFVEDRHAKRLAGRLADEVVGVKDVHNRLMIA